MDIIKKTKRSQFKNEGGILCSEIKDSTTIESTEFYIQAPFPNYQGYENAFLLQKTVSENAFLNDLKKNNKCISLTTFMEEYLRKLYITENELIIDLDKGDIDGENLQNYLKHVCNELFDFGIDSRHVNIWFSGTGYHDYYTAGNAIPNNATLTANTSPAGDILISTKGFVAGDNYTIILEVR